MFKLWMRVDLPRKNKESIRHPAYIVLLGQTIEEIAAQLLDIGTEYDNMEIMTQAPASLTE